VVHDIKYYLLLSINGNSCSCLQLWGSYVQGYMDACYIGRQSKLQVEDGEDHDLFGVVVIMTECIVGRAMKAITCHHLTFAKLTYVQWCATIKFCHQTKVVCTQIITHCSTYYLRQFK